MLKHITRIVILTVIGTVLFNFFNRSAPHYDQNYAVSYSDFITDIRNNGISEVVIDGNNVEGRRQNGERFTTYNPNDPRMIDELLEYGVKIKVERPQVPSTMMQIMISWAPMLLLIAVTVFFMRKQQMGNQGGQMGFGKSRAKLMAEDQLKSVLRMWLALKRPKKMWWKWSISSVIQANMKLWAAKSHAGF
ncbi:MAG: hypothetical protein RLZ92_1926 [Pseudomonadota bacterium]